MNALWRSAWLCNSGIPIPQRLFHVTLTWQRTTCIFQWSLEREFMYFAGKLVYLIVLPSNQLAVKTLLDHCYIHSVCRWSLPILRSSLKEGPSVTFLSTQGRSGRKPLTAILRHKIPKFHKYPQRGSWAKPKYVSINIHVHALVQPHPRFSLKQIILKNSKCTKILNRSIVSFINID